MPPPLWEHTVFFNIDPRLLEQSGNGNYDFPPASGNDASGAAPPPPFDSAPQGPHPSSAARFLHLRELLNSERLRARRVREVDRQDLQNLINGEGDDALRERNRQRLRGLEIVDIEESNMRRDEQRRRANILERGTRPPVPAALTHGDRDAQPFVVPPSLSSPGPPRMRARPGGRYLQRQRQRNDQRHLASSGGLLVAAGRLVEASSSLSALLDDEPMHRITSPDLFDFAGDEEGNRWAKRRKLDSDNEMGGFHSFSYGHYGQVVPGPLKMEIHSCDGGAYSEPLGDMSGADNVLVDDNTVYCTKTDVCNIILQHQGRTTFDLRKLIIKSPQGDFDAPIQEGMVFISMSSEDLLARTTQYQIRYISDSQPGDPYDRRPANSRHGGVPQTVSADPIYSHRPRQSNSLARISSVQRIPAADSESEDEFRNLIQDPTNPDLDRHPTPAPDASLFRVTTDFDDKSDNEDEGQRGSDQPQAPVGFISRASWLIPYSQRASDSSDSEDDDDGSDEDNAAEDQERDNVAEDPQRNTPTITHILSRRAPRLQSDFQRASSRRRHMPNLIEVEVHPSESGTHNSTTETPIRPEVMVPHARFFIERHKSMVSLKFDPPVSGRFILIKLWSPYSGGNIDVQSIIAHGFAGPRFFPSMEMR